MSYSLESMNVILFGKVIFADVIKLRASRHEGTYFEVL